MKRYSLLHLSDDSLLRNLSTATERERGATAEVLALIAEVDERKLYLPAGYESMFVYCVRVLHYCEQAAYKRITVARLGRRFPGILAALAQGRLHLSGIVLLAAHITEETAAELLAAAEHRTKSEIEKLLADRFPKSDLLAWIEPTPVSQPANPEPGVAAPRAELNAASVAGQLSPGRVQGGHEVHKVTPLSSRSYGVQFTMSASAHENLRYAQALLGHEVASGNIAGIMERALALLVAHLEKQKFAATDRRRRPSSRAGTNPRHIPAHVRRAVWERDGGQCTFVSESGHRCEARRSLEFDHVLEVARGGEASVQNLQLRCRAHNQYTAERTFGADFMRHKRIAAAEAQAGARETTEVRATAT